VCNRYVGSNLAHMGGKMKDKGLRMKFTKWLEKLEYEENEIPKEDLVIFLHVPVEVSRKLISFRKLDIHEADLEYLGRVVDVYNDLSQNRKNWVKVDCVQGGKILKPEEIHKEVLKVLGKMGLLNT